jgi:hypothetical protein
LLSPQTRKQSVADGTLPHNSEKNPHQASRQPTVITPFAHGNAIGHEIINTSWTYLACCAAFQSS